MRGPACLCGKLRNLRPKSPWVRASLDPLGFSLECMSFGTTQLEALPGIGYIKKIHGYGGSLRDMIGSIP